MQRPFEAVNRGAAFTLTKFKSTDHRFLLTVSPKLASSLGQQCCNRCQRTRPNCCNQTTLRLPESSTHSHWQKSLHRRWTRCSKTIHQLQSLIGTLQFVLKVVAPGRIFLQRMINLTRGVPSRFHHVCLNKEFFWDLSMWRVFLTSWNRHSLFLDSFLTAAPDLELYTDAASTVGFGGYFNGKWFQGRWPHHLLINKLSGIGI